MRATWPPILRLVLPMLLGMVTSVNVCGWLSVSLVVLLALMAVLLLLMFVFDKRPTVHTFALSLFLFCFIFGFTWFQLRYERVREGVNIASHELKGIVEDEPQWRTKTFAVRVRDDRRRVLLYLRHADDLQINDSIAVFLRYGLQSTCPADVRDTAFADYRRYLFYQGISGTSYVPDTEWMVLHRADRLSLPARLRSLRPLIGRLYRERGIDGDEGAIINAMTIGNRQGISHDLRYQFASAGVSHVLALSGFHLTIIYAVLELLLLARVVSRRWKILSRSMVLVLIWAFVLIAGMPPSLIRAAIMCSVMTVSGYFQGEFFPMNSLSIAAFLMLIANPFSLMDVGFQLSFLSMLGLSTVGVWMFRRWTVRNGVLRYAWGIVLTTLSCTLFTLPLVAHYFGVVPLLSVFSNLFVSVLATVLLALSVVWWLVFPFAVVQEVLTWCLMRVASAMDGITRWIASMEWGILHWRPSWLMAVLCYVVLALLCRLGLLLWDKEKACT